MGRLQLQAAVEKPAVTIPELQHLHLVHEGSGSACPGVSMVRNEVGWPTGVQPARRPSLPCQIPRASHLSSGFVILGAGSTFLLAGLEAVRGCEDNEVLESSDVLLRLPYMKLSSA